MALDIWNTLHLETGGSGIEISGEGSDLLPSDSSNMVHDAVSRIYRELGRSVPSFRIVCHNEIPLARGLGSSSAALVGGLVAGNAVCGNPLSRSDLLDIAVDIEGHPDNVAPALMGGCQIAVLDNGRIVTAPVPAPDDLAAVLFVPNAMLHTKEGRAMLNPNVPRIDAVFNIGRTALLVQALATGDLTRLDVATDDRLHQPARQAMFPAMRNLFRAALGAGAMGVFLSGSGPTVLALTRDREFTIGYEMADAAAKSGIDGQVKITRLTKRGAHVAEDT
ncbi:homoserine kinase [Dehalococcoidia bacterium]|nr:homoserine kinase [Dehalococcoidia bacterium]